MNFRDFFEMSTLMDLLDIPQRPDYHQEGPVKVHVKMVRAQLDAAIQTFQTLAAIPDSALSEIDPHFTQEDRNVLKLAAWLHDIGKVPTTDPDTLRAIKHEMPWYFNPMANELLKSPLWKKMADNASFEDKKDLWYLVKNHMALKDKGFKKRLSRQIVDENGKYKNTRRVKLLIAFILMDRAGRIGKKDPVTTPDALEMGAKRRARAMQRQSEPAPDDERAFVQMMMPRVASRPEAHRMSIMRGALRGKFGRDFSDEEIMALMQ